MTSLSDRWVARRRRVAWPPPRSPADSARPPPRRCSTSSRRWRAGSSCPRERRSPPNWAGWEALAARARTDVCGGPPSLEGPRGSSARAVAGLIGGSARAVDELVGRVGVREHPGATGAGQREQRPERRALCVEALVVAHEVAAGVGRLVHVEGVRERVLGPGLAAVVGVRDPGVGGQLAVA